MGGGCLALYCMTCNAPWESGEKEYTCPHCGGSVEPDNGLEENREEFCRILKEGSREGIWGYRRLFPYAPRIAPVSLGEGNTPLLRAGNLESKLGMGPLYLKNETLNPSGSYKDRFSSLAVTMAKEKEVSALALGSAGNAAGSVAAYAAKGQIPCYVLLPTAAVRERAWQIQNYGARMIGMECTIAECIHYVQEGVSVLGWENVSTTMKYHPWASQGYKTIAYEIGRQMEFQAPDWVICPVGGASLLGKVYQGFQEMYRLGLIPHIPRLAGIQASGCAPLVKAYKENLSATELWREPDTIAFAIADTETFEGVTALDIIRRTGGTAEEVTDTEIIEGLHLLAASEGVVGEPASASVIAGAKKLFSRGLIGKEDSVVCIISGSGLKDLPLIAKSLPAYPIINPGDGKTEDEERVMAELQTYYHI
jgi:threonine synthase